MLRFILFLFLFYFVHKVIKYAFRFLNTPGSKDRQDNIPKNPKYKNIEEAVYTEIKPEDEKVRRDNS